MKTVIEPYRVKVVEAIRLTTPDDRVRLLEAAGFNLFNLRADDVIIDLLTDSGTSAMSDCQWAGVMKADESYAGAGSFFKFENAVTSLFGFPHVLPVHQGRAGERIFFESTVGRGDIIPSNTHFDTTRANLERLSAIACDLPCRKTNDGEVSFGGNIDLSGLEKLLKAQHERVPFGMLTLTNNACAGQPVSYENVAAAAELLRSYGKCLYIDAARVIENAFFIRWRDQRFSGCTIEEVVRGVMGPAAGCLMSCKKDGLANIGGLIALRDGDLARKLKSNLIVTEGFPTYGGLSGRDLEAIAIGLTEASDLNYLQHRWRTATRLAGQLVEQKVPVVIPPAMHAVYLDASAFFSHLRAEELPGQALACELYLEAGIRSCEIGTVMFGADHPVSRDLVRLALPRRLYSQSHYDYVVEAIVNVFERRESVPGLRIVENEFVPLRHFSARFQPVAKGGVVKAVSLPERKKAFNARAASA